MFCDLATVLLALKLANGQLPPSDYIPGVTRGTWEELPDNMNIMWGNDETQRKLAQSMIDARLKRKDDKAFIERTLKECGQQK